MSGKDWTIAFVFVLLHLAVAVIRGVPIGLVLSSALFIMVAWLILSKRF